MNRNTGARRTIFLRRLLPAAEVILLCLGSAAPLRSQAGVLEEGRVDEQEAGADGRLGGQEAGEDGRLGGQEARSGSRPEKPADTAVSGGLLQDARTLAAEGKLAEAAGVYAGWLGQNVGHPSFGEVLIEAAESQLSVERALELLRVYTPRVCDPAQRELCLASQIDLLQMLGRTEQALGLLRSYPSSPQWLYRQAQLLYQQGLADEALQSLEQARGLLAGEAADLEEGRESDVDGRDPLELEARIWLLQARIYVLEGKHGEAESLFEVLSARYAGTAAAPGILLAYYEYLMSVGKEPEAAKQIESLAERFPDSPEMALAVQAEGDGRIAWSPTPSRLLPRSLEGRPPQPAVQVASGGLQEKVSDGGIGATGEGGGETAPPSPVEAAPGPVQAPPPEPTQPQKVMVQTGSFRDPENAHYMVRDLKASGFEAAIVEKRVAGTLYYRVVVGSLMPIETAQAVLMKLKDANFEGVFLFPD